MPNATNIASPINIHGIGRSGTTVIQNVLNRTGFIQTCNEMAPFVFSTYRGAQLGVPSHDKEAPGLPGDSVLAVRAVHGAMCAAYSSSKPSWSQKLGGIPNQVVWSMTSEADRAFAAEPYPFPYQWYWDTVHHLFPQGKDILILRDYRDILISGVEMFHQPLEDLAKNLAVYFNILAHPASRIDHVVRFEQLIADPAKTLDALFGAIGIQFRDDYLLAMGSYAAASGTRGLGQARDAGFSWSDRHAMIDETVMDIVGPSLLRLGERLDVALAPPGWAPRSHTVSEEKPSPGRSTVPSTFSTEIIDLWKTTASRDYRYFEKVEDQIDVFWLPGRAIRDQFDLMDLTCVVEIACSMGRHTAQVARLGGTIWATDTSIDALVEVRRRFSDVPNVRPLLVSGDSALSDIPSGSVTAAFSYDSMVHFEMLTVAGYLAELSRVLKPGGKALLHHSNHDANPEGRFSENPGWRNYMTADLMRHLASRNHLRVVSQTVLDWSIPQLDMLTLLERK
jgi:SAM-dependent methyltransferase